MLFDEEVAKKLDGIHRIVTATHEKVSRMSEEVDDLTQAVSDLTTAVTASVSEIDSLAAQITTASANGDHDAVEGLVAKIKAQTAALNTVNGSTQAAAPAPADPAPAPAPADPAPDGGDNAGGAAAGIASLPSAAS